MYDPGPMVYMMKWVVGAEAVGVIDLDAPITRNLEAIARAKGKDVDALTVIMLDRPRHEEMFEAVRSVGARLRLIMDGDVAAALLAALPDKPVDVLLGIGGTPEGVITACAVKALGGEMIGRLWARNDDERRRAEEMGYDLAAPIGNEELVAGNDTFFVCTGITPGDLVDGVEYTRGGAVTDSLVMRGKSGTIRQVRARHTFAKLMQYSSIDFD